MNTRYISNMLLILFYHNEGWVSIIKIIKLLPTSKTQNRNEKYKKDYQYTIYDLKKKGVLDEAIISRVGRKIVFDAEKARVLASNYQSDQREKK